MRTRDHRPAGVLALGAALLVACGGGSREPPRGAGRAWPAGRPASYVNPIPGENALGGDPGWSTGNDGAGLQAYLDRASARAGDLVRVKAATDAAHAVSWALYRFGWYGGAGARRVAGGGPARLGPQQGCPMEPATGMIRCAWPAAFEVRLPADAVSGYWAVKLTRDDGLVFFAPLVVVDDRPADLLLDAASNTWQAYNAWGGESLYADQSGTLPGGKGSRVSYDRPYDSHRGLGLANRYEIPFARFLEKYGYDVSYTTNPDMAAGGPAHLLRAGAFLVAGHDEYWTGEQRDAAEQARDAGMPLLFFGANSAYWKGRLEAPDGAAGPRIFTCYKVNPASDPDQGPGRTGRFRDPPFDRPEVALEGAMYESFILQRFPLVVADASSFVFEGTGLREGDAVPLLGGNEYDVATFDAAQPAGTKVVGRIPLVDAFGTPGTGTTVHYTAPSGALVFDAATIDWPLGVDPNIDTYDARVERMTANVIHAAIGVGVPAGVGTGPVDHHGLFLAPVGPTASGVGTLATGLSAPAGVAALADGSVLVALPREHRIVRVRPDGAVEPFAGDGQLSTNPAYDNVPAARARFFGPTALLAMPDGSVLVADTLNGCIRRIGADAAHTVTTFAGRMGQTGYAEGVAANARFNAPMGLARDPRTGDVLVADTWNHAVRAISTLGVVRTLAGGRLVEVDGPAASAGFFGPTAVATSPDGRVFVVASTRSTVKRIGTDPARTVTTIAGAGSGGVDGSGDAARFLPQGGAVWAGNRLLVSDPGNSRVRSLDCGADMGATAVRTFAGTGAPGATDGPGASARLGLPLGLAVGPDGRVYVADGTSGAVRVITP